MSTFPMIDHVERYLALRRAMGFDLGIAGGQLMQFARFAQSSDAGSLTFDVAIAWANSARHPTPLTSATPAPTLNNVRMRVSRVWRAKAPLAGAKYA